MICFGMGRLLLIALLLILGKGYGTKITWQLLTEPIYFGLDVVMSCYRPYFSGEMYFAWLNKDGKYIAVGNTSLINDTKYEVKILYTKTGINYTLTIKSFDSDDVNTTYRCNIGFESYLANLITMNTSFLYPPKSEDLILVDRTESNQIIQVLIWKAYPKPACHFFIGNSRIEGNNNSTYERVSVFYKVTFRFSFETISKYCDEVLLVTCFVGTTAFNYTRIIPIDLKETGQPNGLVHLLILIPVVIVTMLVICLFACSRKGLLCWKVNEKNSKKYPQLQLQEIRTSENEDAGPSENLLDVSTNKHPDDKYKE